jgi:hypothetical protein
MKPTGPPDSICRSAAHMGTDIAFPKQSPSRELLDNDNRGAQIFEKYCKGSGE